MHKDEFDVILRWRAIIKKVLASEFRTPTDSKTLIGMHFKGSIHTIDSFDMHMRVMLSRLLHEIFS